jgi:hypothetical protein
MTRNFIRGTRCTVERRGGQFCDGPSAEGMPFPICAHHATKLYRWIRDSLTEADPLLIATAITRSEDARVAQTEQRRRQTKPVVYYIQVGDLIKIGYTIDLRLRVRAYPPSRKVLATEPGTPALEATRHGQFKDCRAHGREWFHHDPALLTHINRLRSESGASPLDIAAMIANTQS